MHGITHLLFDWGDTLMWDDPAQSGPMYLWEEVTPMPGVAETLPLLAGTYTCAVASNAGDSDAAAMRKAFVRAGLDLNFSMFLTSRELGAAKPAPGFFLGALQLLGAMPSHTCMIGNDYGKDIVGAKEAGLRTIYITGEKTIGFFPAADHVVLSFDRLPMVLPCGR